MQKTNHTSFIGSFRNKHIVLHYSCHNDDINGDIVGVAVRGSTLEMTRN